MKTNRNILSIAGVVVLVLIAGSFLYPHNTGAPRQGGSQTNQVIGQTNTVTVSIQGLYTNKQVQVTSGETVLEVLQTLNNTDQTLALSTKTYAGLGVLVDGMAGTKNGTDKKYWQYKVNGVMPQIGADTYALKSGDSVVWFFGTSEE